MSRIPILSLFFALGATALPAQQGDGLPPGVTREQMWYAPKAEDWAKPCTIPWQRTWADAVELSESTRKAILVCVNMDGEIASEHWAGIRYRTPEIAALFEEYVCVIASTFRHNPRDYDENGERIPCPRFGTVTCGEHIWMEPTVYGLFLDETRVAPRHIMVELDGSEVYDLYYVNGIDPIVQRITTAIEEREIQPEEPPKGDRSLAELVQSADAADRAQVESTWSAGDREARREILGIAAETGARISVDLLRKAAFGFDSELSDQALDLLAVSKEDKAVGLINDLLHGPLEPERRAQLLASLDRLSGQVPMAKRLVTVHRGLVGESSMLDLEAWNAGMQVIEEPATSVVYGTPEDLLLEAVHVDNLRALESDSPRVRRVAEENFRLARQAAESALAGGTEDWHTHAVISISAHYLGDPETARMEARRAIELLPPGETSWTAYATLSVFAEAQRTAIRAAADAKRDWPSAWLSEEQEAYAVLAAHPLTTELEVVRHYDFLIRLGAVAPASRALKDGLQEFPQSGALHERFRLLLVAESGANGVEPVYERWLQREDAPAHLVWFAGRASLYVAEEMRKVNRLADAGDAYARALEHFSKQVQEHPETQANTAPLQVLATAGQARVALELGDAPRASELIRAAFALHPESAANLDGLNVSPVGTARKIQAELAQSGDIAGATEIQKELDALGEIDTGLLELPVFEQRR